MIDIEEIKKLREATGAGVMEAKKALEDSANFEEAVQLIQKEGLAKASKKEGRQTSQGAVAFYLHANGKVGGLVSLLCETDFVARTDDFKKLGNELAMQIAAMDPKDLDELLAQEYIREPGRKVKDLIVELSAKVGENITVGEFKRIAI